MRSRIGWSRLSVGTKVILPFLVLVLVLSLLVSWFASQALAASAAAATSAQAQRETASLNANLNSFELRQGTLLRTVSATPGLAAATRTANAAPLAQSALFAAVANVQPDPLKVGIIGPGGAELAHVSATADGQQCVCTSGRNLSSWPHVRDVLAGRSDNRAPRYAAVTDDSDGAILYTIGPITEGQKVVGAIFVGEPLTYLVGEAHTLSGFDLALYEPAGRLLAGTADIPSPPAQGTHAEVSVRGRQEVVFAVPWRVRGASAGRALVMVPADAAVGASGSLPLVLVAVFAAAVVVTVLVGGFISRTLTRPLGRLVRATDEVASGHLGYRVRVASADEIGRLTGAFNRMTASLEQSAEHIAANTEATLQTLAAAIDARDAYTAGHSMRVMRYSVEMAQVMGFDDQQVEMIRRGCMVHDIGKIGVRDSVLGKPARLTQSEEAQMRLHPLIGHSMLRHLVWEQPIRDIVLHHHERWDGEGYPGRLTGDEIPYLARLVGVADTLDAMTSDRPYRKAHTFAVATEEIRRASGRQFAPAAVEAFNRASARLEVLVGELAPSGAADPVDLAALLEAMAG